MINYKKRLIDTAIEIKLGAIQIEEAANNLIKIKNLMIEKGIKPPKYYV